MVAISSQIRYAILAAAVSLAFGVITSSLPVNISQKDPSFGYGSDAEIYWDLSGNFINKKSFVHSPGFDFNYIYKTNEFVYGTQRTPGYPLVLAAARWLTGAGSPGSWGIIFFNGALVFLNAYFIFGILKKLLPQISSKVNWLVAFFPPFLIYSNGINVDFFTQVLLSGFVYFFLLDSRWKYQSPIIAAFALLTRGNALFFLFPFLLLSILFDRRFKSKAVLGLVGILALGLVFVGWSYRNQKLSGYFIYAPFTGLQLKQNYIDRIDSPVLEQQFAKWKSPEFLKQRFGILLEQSQDNLYWAEAKMNEEITNDVFALILGNPSLAAKTYIRSVAQMSVNEYFIFNLGRSVNNQAVWAFVWVLAVLFFALPVLGLLLLGVWFAINRTTSAFAILIYSGVIYFLVTAAVWGGFARYSLPVSFAALMAIAFLFHKLRWMDFKRLF